MEIKRILLTGDDGYNSVGIRLLARALRDQYDISIAATKHQQTGVGGKISLATGGSWGEDTVDGIPAFWVEGTPADVMECAQAYYPQPFDLLISGVNLGPNASTAIISSGTFGAAIRGMGAGVAPRALAMSWNAPLEFWHKKHTADEDISSYFAYPGDILAPLIDEVLKAEMWGVSVLNINLPAQTTKTIRFTKILKDIRKYFSYPIELDRETHRFDYDRKPFNIQEKNQRYDVAAIEAGHISITPCAFDMTHYTTFERLEHTKLTLQV